LKRTGLPSGPVAMKEWFALLPDGATLGCQPAGNVLVVAVGLGEVVVVVVSEGDGEVVVVVVDVGVGDGEVVVVVVAVGEGDEVALGFQRVALTLTQRHLRTSYLLM
jgi:hypothetical protein